MERAGGELRGWVVAMVTMTCLGVPAAASAQLGALVSPGRLSRPHAELEGVSNCLSCHTAGAQVSAPKCLSCHVPVAQRIAKKTGVHRNVTADCVSCHVEHAGVDGELRPFDRRAFNHATQTAFPLEGVHAAATCEACHKTRSFLTAASTCAGCHADPHKPTLGSQCERCHATTATFSAATTRFDHNRTEFRLTGAHVKVACAACHVNKTYSGVKFAVCTDCHTNPHATPMGAACASCHTTMSWRSGKVDHSRTSFPLAGKHQAVACEKCHVRPALDVKPRASTCAACHTDPHKGVFTQDCDACHTEAGFEKGTFDHSSTRFPLVDKHAGLTCASCHAPAAAPAGAPAVRPSTPPRPAMPARPSVPSRPAAPARPSPSVRPVASSPRPGAVATQGVQDFRGLSTTCVSCHADVHRGELGVACEACHTARTFAVTTFTHAKNRPFFAGEHKAVACGACHTSSPGTTRASATPAPGAGRAPVPGAEPVARVGFASTSTACVSCHQDVHLGQVGSRCESCHAVDGARFALVGFSHDTTTFPLTGKHAPLICDACHKADTREFPAARGTAKRLTGIGTECIACHADPHAGQLVAACQTCHTVQTFAVSRYTHRNQRALRAFFAGQHVSAACSACHKPAVINASRTPVASYQTSTACVACHRDVHRGALGPDCASCHRP